MIPLLKGLPYPSGPATLAELPRLLAAMPNSCGLARTEIERYASESWTRARLAARIDKAVDWQRRQGQAG